MTRAASSLANLDPRSVPLPHGTEVELRTDRILDERTIPRGTVGRVTGSGDDLVEITIVGVGTLHCAREDLVPRRVGQTLFAVRRDASWSALAPCLVLETIVGSRAWGLADESSDVDTRGVFALPLSWTAGLVDPPHDLVSPDGSMAYWSVTKALRQALRADPNTLEMLFVPGARPRDEIGEWILAEREAFVSSEIHGSFGRYAIAQLRRLEQGARLAEHRGQVLGWLRDEPGLSLDQVAERLADRTPPRSDHGQARHRPQAKEWVKQLYRSLHDQGLLPANDFGALVRFAAERSHDLELPRELRPKNAYNLMRLIWTATEWLRAGRPTFRATGVLHDRLVAIKKGEVPLADVVAEAEALIPALDAARAETQLPDRADLPRADALARRIHEEVARRFAANRPGPWGRDAPPTFSVEWSS